MTLKEEKQKFLLIAKRILKKDLSTNPETLLIYKNDIIRGYNESIRYLSENYEHADKTTQKLYRDYIRFVRGF